MTRSISLVVMLALTAAACRDKPAPAKADPPAKVTNPVGEASLTSITLSDEAVKRLGITTATSAVEAVSRSRTAGGEVIVPPGGAVTVTAPVSGTLQAGGGGVPAVGSQVTRGQAIFSLYPIEPADRDVHLESNRTAASAEAELVLATQRLQRLERLLADGAASQRSVEEARAQQKVAEANAKAAKSRAQDLDSSPTGTGGGMVVRAPIAGVLQAVTAAPGQTVAASAPLFQVSQSDGLWVKVPLFVGERAMIDRSKPAEVASLGEMQGPTTPATPVSGPPSADPTTATTDLFYVLGNTSAVRPGERVSVRLPLSGTQQGLVVPTASILYDLNGGSWVYEATGPNTFVRRRVEIRSQLGTKTLLARGLDPGKKVVVDGAAELFGTEFGAGK